MESLETEWSHLFNIKKLENGLQKTTISASQEQCQNLARRFNITSIENATADLHIKNGNKNIIKVYGTLKATIIQECIVTGSPVSTTISEDVEGWFADPETIVSFSKAQQEKAVKEGQEVKILLESDDPEPFIDDHIDLGELAAQHLSLAIPTYPKTEGTNYQPSHLNSDGKDPAFDNPFAKLAEWKNKLEKE